MYISYDKNNIVRVISPQLIKTSNQSVIKTNEITEPIIGKRIIFGKRNDKLKVALVVNWGDHCGISSYSELLVKSLQPKIGELKIFAEHLKIPNDDTEKVVRCWNRGQSMIEATQKILDWKPDVVSIQHEFGLFPKATHFLKMLEMLEEVPYVITLHSVYEHLDKVICTAYIKNMIVHSENAKESLYRHGHLNNIDIIYHGCVEYENISELWNIFQNNYTVIQFGFGFNYKGVDMAIDAISHLKNTHQKFKDIFYCYLCSESPHTYAIQQEYYGHLSSKVKELGLDDNVVIMRGFLSDEHICNFLRTAKLAIFPYCNNPNNIVYGASGAVRIALANGIPVICSDCHHFDDLEGIIPRIKSSTELANEIDKAFSSEKYRKSLVKNGLEFVRTHNWDITADQHINVFNKIIENFEKKIVRIQDYETI